MEANLTLRASCTGFNRYSWAARLMSPRIIAHSCRTSWVKSVFCFWRTSLRAEQRSHVSREAPRDEFTHLRDAYLNCSTQESFALTKGLLFTLFCFMISFWKFLKLRGQTCGGKVSFTCTHLFNHLYSSKYRAITCTSSLSRWLLCPGPCVGLPPPFRLWSPCRGCTGGRRETHRSASPAVNMLLLCYNCPQWRWKLCSCRSNLHPLPTFNTGTS